MPEQLQLAVLDIISFRSDVARQAYLIADCLVHTRHQVAAVMASDARALQAWVSSAQELALALDGLRVRSLQRLEVIAAAEHAVRERLSSSALTAAQAAWVTARTSWSDLGFGGWVQTVVGPVRVPVSGDPLWISLLAGLT